MDPRQMRRIGTAVMIVALGANVAWAQSRVVLNEVLAVNRTSVEREGSYPDWIELFNPTDAAVDLEGVSLSDDPEKPRRFVFPAGTELAARARLVVYCDRSDSGEGWHADFRLSGEGGTVGLYDTPARGGQVLDVVTFGPQAADISLGRWPEGSGPWGVATPTPGETNETVQPAGPGVLVLNEWMADSAPGGSDWFELYNPSDAVVPLGGLVFTVTPDAPENAAVPALTFIGSGEFLCFLADKNEDLGPLHLDFKLPAAGADLALMDADRKTVLTRVSYGRQTEGVSEGWLPDGNQSGVVVFAATASPGGPNWAPLRNGVVINEILSHTDPPFEDAIELHNPGSAPASVGGYYLGKNAMDPRRFQIPVPTVIPAGGYVVFYENEFGETASSGGFALNSARGGEVVLSEADAEGTLTGYRTSVEFGAAFNGVSVGRHTTSVGTTFVALEHPTFGGDEPSTLAEFRRGAGAGNAQPMVGPVVITELMVHPVEPSDGLAEDLTGEFIELQNMSAARVTLFDVDHRENTWRLRRGIEFDFPEGIALDPGEVLLVAAFDPAADPVSLARFRARYGVPAEVQVLGPFSGKLANEGETVELRAPDTPQGPNHPDVGFVPYVVIEQVEYRTGWPWPTETDGRGASLQRRNSAAYGNDVANWTAAAPTAGRVN